MSQVLDDINERKLGSGTETGNHSKHLSGTLFTVGYTCLDGHNKKKEPVAKLNVIWHVSKRQNCGNTTTADGINRLKTVLFTQLPRIKNIMDHSDVTTH